MDWGDLRHFLALCRAGTLAGAARELRVAETTVGRRVAALEKALGARLVERHPGGLCLTAAGQDVRDAAAHMEEAATEVERRAFAADARLAGRVRVAATDALGLEVVLPALAPLRSSHPELAVELVTGPRALDLARRDADVAVRLVSPAGRALVVRRLCRVGFAAYASRDYLAGRPPGAPWAGTGDRGVSYADTIRSAPEARLAAAGVQLAVRVSSPYALARALALGAGLGILPCYLGDAHPELVRAWPREPPELHDLWVVVHPDVRRAPRVRAVLDALVAGFAAASVRLAGATKARWSS